MKLKYIFTALVAALTLAVGCEDDLERYLDEVQVSSSYVAIPAAGGSQTITVNAKTDWSFGDIPEWLTVSPTSGVAGETTVSFKADAATSTNEAMLYLNCDGKSQIINVLQQTEKVEPQVIPLKEFLAKEVSPTVYRIAGTISNIQEISASYKNATLTISDDEGYSVYLYRFGPPSGQKIEDLGMEVGDFLTVEGARGEYQGSPQMAQGGVFVSLVKSLIKVDSVSVKEPLPIEGGEFKAYLTCKGEGVSVVVPDDAKSWLSVTSIETSGTNATVTFNAGANTGGDRSTSLVFNTTSNGKAYSAQASLEQKGAIIDATVAEFLAAAEGDTQYRVTGVITNISASSQYHNANITISSGDFSSSVLLYRAVTNKGNIEDLGLVEGDVITVVGKRSSYNGTPQMAAGGVYESHIRYNKATLAEFLAAPVGNDIYAVTGEITAVANLSAQYNNVNITIKDESNTLYLYRVTTFDKTNVETLNPEVGGTITVAGKRGEYNGSAQMAAGGVVLAYSAPTGGGDEPQPGPGENLYSIDLNYTLGTNAWKDAAKINGAEEAVDVLKFGTSSKVGDVTITVPAGSKRVTFYAVAWKGAATTLEFSTGGVTTGTIDIKANDGASNTSPYTLTVTDDDKYEIKVDTALPSDMDFKITTVSGKKTRAIIFGVKAFKE